MERLIPRAVRAAMVQIKKDMLDIVDSKLEVINLENFMVLKNQELMTTDLQKAKI